MFGVRAGLARLPPCRCEAPLAPPPNFAKGLYGPKGPPPCWVTAGAAAGREGGGELAPR